MYKPRGIYVSNSLPLWIYPSIHFNWTGAAGLCFQRIHWGARTCADIKTGWAVWPPLDKSVTLSHHSSSPAGGRALVQGEGKALGARWSLLHSEGYGPSLASWWLPCSWCSAPQYSSGCSVAKRMTRPTCHKNQNNNSIVYIDSSAASKLLHYT